MTIYRSIYLAVALTIIYGILGVHSPITHAETEIETLQKQITERGSRLKDIEAEIAGYQTELKKVGGEKNSLQKAINQLEIERKKVQADINYTQNKIGSTDLEISKLGIEIDATESEITRNKMSIGETIQTLNELDDDTFVELILRYKSLSEFWEKIDELDQFRLAIANNVRALASQQLILKEKYGSNTKKKS